MDYIGCKIYQVHSVSSDGLSGVFTTTYLNEARASARRINAKGRACSIVTYQCIDIEDFLVIKQTSIFDEVEDVPQSS